MARQGRTIRSSCANRVWPALHARTGASFRATRNFAVSAIGCHAGTAGGWARFCDRDYIKCAGACVTISGNKILGPNANCTAGRVHVEKGHFSVQLSCSDTIMFSSVSMALRGRPHSARAPCSTPTDDRVLIGVLNGTILSDSGNQELVVKT